eukprot:c16566_g1_i1.p1 GENE.c16566_g1_i1~~c16566_g1_i1.p1  ORF type:complete len:788 (-),score=137.31 c16566_g1_i1:144-2477(-)
MINPIQFGSRLVKNLEKHVDRALGLDNDSSWPRAITTGRNTGSVSHVVISDEAPTLPRGLMASTSFASRAQEAESFSAIPEPPPLIRVADSTAPVVGPVKTEPNIAEAVEPPNPEPVEPPPHTHPTPQPTIERSPTPPPQASPVSSAPPAPTPPAAPTPSITTDASVEDAQIHRLTQQVQSLNSALSELHTTLTDREKELDDVKASRAEIERKNRQLTQEATELRKLQELINRKTVILEKKEQDADKAMRDINQFRRVNAELERTVHELRKELKAREDEMKAHTEAVTEANALLSEKSDRVEQLEAHEAAFADTLAQLRNKLQQSDQALASTTHENQLLRTELTNAKQEARDALEKVRSLESQLTDTDQRAGAYDLVQREFETRRQEWEMREVQSRLQLEKVTAELDNMRLALAREREAADQMEEHLREDMRTLQERAERAERRNEERGVASSLDATQPLIMQIETLTRELEEQANRARRREKELLAQVLRTDALATEATERYNTSTATVLRLETALAEVQMQCADCLRQKGELQDALALARTEAEENAARCKRFERLAEEKSRELSEKQARWETENERLRVSLSAEQHRYEAAHAALDVANMRSSIAQRLDATPTRKSSFSSSAGATNLDPEEQPSQSQLLEESLYETVSNATEQSARRPATNYERTVTSHQYNLRLRELQDALQRVADLEHTCEALVGDIARMTAAGKKRDDEIAQLRPLRTEYDALMQRYGLMLELIGEKDEEIEDLKGDIEQMRTMYRTQLDDLVAKLAASKK